MATLEEQRRGSGAAMAAQRGTGTQMASSRRASGAAMEARRTGRELVDTLGRLTEPTRTRTPLRAIEPRGSLPAQRGRGDWKAGGGGGAGGGIASPLTEKTKVVAGKTVPDNELWPAGYPSSDGLFVLPAWKTLNFTDANGAEVVLEYANPAGVAV